MGLSTIQYIEYSTVGIYIQVARYILYILLYAKSCLMPSLSFLIADWMLSHMETTDKTI